MDVATLDRVLAALAAAAGAYPVPSVTAMAAAGGRQPYRMLVATLLSLRTKDAVTDAAASRLFARAADPRAMLAVPEDEIARLVYPVGFYRAKARTIREVSRLLLERHAGAVPGTLEELLALPGVGRKTANLTLIHGFGGEGICVDTHVHRIANRLGFVRTKTPDETEAVLRERLPRAWWTKINDVLVAWGQYVCAPLSPRCSLCVAAGDCERVGVGRRR